MERSLGRCWRPSGWPLRLPAAPHPRPSLTASYQAAIQRPAIVREDDGLPPQTPPPFRVRQVTDDPSEPFSFNYGPLPPRRLSNAEAEAVIARAITEHEMRKP